MSDIQAKTIDEVLKKLDWRYDFSGDVVKENLDSVEQRNVFAAEAREAAKAALSAMVDSIIGRDREYGDNDLPVVIEQIKTENREHANQRQRAAKFGFDVSERRVGDVA